MIEREFAERRVGEVLDGRYQLVRLLGVGMTGAVYEARHEYTKRKVAVKIMHRQLVTDDTLVARFLREAKSVAKIGHASIVEVYDAGETQDKWPYVALELLVGRSLGETLRETGKLLATDVIAIGTELLDGLAAAHDAGIVHRDMKPDNVFLMDPPVGGRRVKILDFGVAKNLKSTGSSAVLTRPGAAIGTPSYMSPEQARGAEVDARTDIWSVGALLFHAVAGRPPFVETNVPSLLLKLVTTRAPRLADIVPDAPANLAKAIDGALEPDANQRFPTAKHMARALTK
ncbi:MAG: serine/threonine-protein kinase [Sandaracinaceae bacterium]